MDTTDARTLPLRALSAIYADDDPDQAITAGEVYSLIRLALVKRDHSYRPGRAGHALEASTLHLELAAAYVCAGAPVGEQDGELYYHAWTLRRVARHLADVSVTPSP